MVPVGHGDQELQILELHVLAVTLEPCLEFVGVEDAVEVFVEEAEGFDEFGMLFAHDLFLFAG